MKTLSFKDIQFILEGLEQLLNNYKEKIKNLENIEDYEDEVSDLSNDSLFLEELIKDLQNQQNQEFFLLVSKPDLSKMDLDELIQQGKQLSINERFILVAALTSSIREEYNLIVNK